MSAGVSWHLASALLTILLTPLHRRRPAAVVIAPGVLSWQSHTYRAWSHKYIRSAHLVHNPSAPAQISFRGDGPLGSVIADTNGHTTLNPLLTLFMTPLRSASVAMAPLDLSWRSHTYRAQSHNFEPSARLVHDPSAPVQISFRGDGPLGSVMAIADAKGMVKGRVDNPAADPPLRSDGKLNVGEAVGLGAWKGSGRGRGLGGVKGVGAVARVCGDRRRCMEACGRVRGLEGVRCMAAVCGVEVAGLGAWEGW